MDRIDWRNHEHWLAYGTAHPDVAGTPKSRDTNPPTPPAKSVVKTPSSPEPDQGPELLAVVTRERTGKTLVVVSTPESHSRVRDVSRTVLRSAPTKESDT